MKKEIKRCVAWIVAVLMTIGSVNLPSFQTKAAENERTISLNSASTAQVNAPANLYRYLIYLDGFSTDDISAMNPDSVPHNFQVTIDGKAKTIRAWNGGSGRILLPLNYSELEAGVKDPYQLSPHTLVIKAGTVGAYTITKDLSISLDRTWVRDTSTLTEVTLDVHKSSQSQDKYASGADAKRYVLYYNVDPASEVSALTSKDIPISVDGKGAVGNKLYASTNSVFFPLYYTTLESGAVYADSLTETHTATVRAGSIINGTHIVKKSVTYTLTKGQVTGGSISPEEDHSRVTLSYHAAGSGSQNNLKRYFILLDGANLTQMTGLHAKKPTLYVDGEKLAKSTSDFYKLSDTSFALLLHYNDVQSGATTAAEIGKHKVEIKAGTVVGSYTIAKDFVLTINQSSIVEGSSDISFRLGGQRVHQPNYKRYLIQLSGVALEQMNALHGKAPIMYIDGVVKQNPKTVYYKLNDELFVLLLVYDDLKAGATTAAEAGAHTIEFRKGTLAGAYTIERDLVIHVDNGAILEEPYENPNLITLSVGAGSEVQDNKGQYLIDLDGATKEQIAAFHQRRPEIYVDGKKKNADVTFSRTGDNGDDLALLVKYSALEDGVESASSLGTHTIEIKADTNVNGYTFRRALSFKLQGNTVTPLTSVMLHYNDYTDQNWDGLNRYYINFRVEGANSPFTKEGVSLSKDSVIDVDGEKKTGINYVDSTSKAFLTLLLKYTDLDAGATAISQVGDHKVVIKEGTVIGDNLYVTKDCALHINGATVEKVLEAAESGNAHLTVTEETGYDEDGNYQVYAMPSEVLSGTAGETVYPMTISVDDTICQVDAQKTSEGELAFTIPKSKLSDTFTLTLPAGEYGSVSFDEFTLYVNEYGCSTEGYYVSKGENVALDLVSGTATGITLTAGDSVTVTGNEAHRVNDGESGVYYNGESTDAYLKKTAAGTWMVCLGGSLIQARAGDNVIVTGTFATGTECVSFDSISLTYNGSTWTVNTGVTTLPELTADVEDNGFYLVPEGATVKEGTVTANMLRASGSYTIETTIGDITCEREVVLYRKFDIDGDNDMDVLDLIILKKHSLGMKDLSKSGTLASHLGGADTEENLKALRAEFLEDYRLKTGEALPTDIIGQTGAGSYITDMQATEDGTAVYSIADTDNGYRTQGTYENSGLDYVLDFDTDRNLKVLQLTDPLLADSTQMRDGDTLETADLWRYNPKYMETNAFRYIRQTVEAAEPDVIFITGNMVYGRYDDDGSSFTKFVELMDSFKIPWAPVFGDHDNESKMGVAWQCEQLMKSDYCLFNRRNSIGGNGNYSVGLAKNGTLERVMYLMDSNACQDAAERGEPVADQIGFTKTQLDWYRSLALQVNAFAGQTVPSFLCYHMPTTDVVTASRVAGYLNILTDQLTRVGGYTIGDEYPAQSGDIGSHEENFKDVYTCDGLLDIMQEVGTDGAFFGHNNKNSTSVKYGDVRWTFGLKSSKYGSYQKELGGVLVTLPSAGAAFTVEHIAFPEIDLANTKFDIIIQAGQSNAEGRGIGAVEESLQPVFSYNAWQLDQNMEISQASEWLADGSRSRGNFSWTFSDQYEKAGLLEDGRQLLVIKAAVGGTGFNQAQWGLGNSLHTQMIEMVDYALSLNPENRVVGFLWHQGENDCFVGSNTGFYKSNLTATVEDVRSRYGADIPFIAGDFVPEWKGENATISDPIAAIIREVVAEVGNSAFVESTGLQSNKQNVLNEDNIHFCRESLCILGNRYFEKYQELIAQ